MKILDRLPIPENRTSLQFGNKYATVHRNQVLVWVSVHLAGAPEPEENIPRFPALLDTGNNFAFSVQDRHLREWAGIDPGLLVALGDIEIDRQVVMRRRATVWLYPGFLCHDRPRRDYRLFLSCTCLVLSFVYFATFVVPTPRPSPRHRGSAAEPAGAREA
jgi:hypothetical protein